MSVVECMVCVCVSGSGLLKCVLWFESCRSGRSMSCVTVVYRTMQKKERVREEYIQIRTVVEYNNKGSVLWLDNGKSDNE